MSDDVPSSPVDLSGLDFQFAPAWAKESGRPSSDARLTRLAARHDEGDRSDRRPRRGPRDQGNKPRGSGGRPPRREESPRSEPKPITPVQGWEAIFLPHAAGIDGLVRQIRASARAYSLFELARLVLDKSERYQVRLRRTSDTAAKLFQLQADGSLWLTESDAVQVAVEKHLERYYRREKITVDPPKGAFSVVAICGMSGTVLGPPNHHAFQGRLKALHAERFSHVPFEVFKSRVRNEKDEALINQWKEEQSTQEVYFPLESEEKLTSRDEVARHFRQHHIAEVVAIVDEVTVPGPAAMNDSAPAVLALTRDTWRQVNRFPLPVAHVLGEGLGAKGLQIFKAGENLTYVGVARPRFLDRHANPISERMEGILLALEKHKGEPRAKQWEALVATYPESDDREKALTADLFWLLHEGHVVDYAGKNLVVTPRTEKAGKAAA